MSRISGLGRLAVGAGWGVEGPEGEKVLVGVGGRGLFALLPVLRVLAESRHARRAVSAPRCCARSGGPTDPTRFATHPHLSSPPPAGVHPAPGHLCCWLARCCGRTGWCTTLSKWVARGRPSRGAGQEIDPMHRPRPRVCSGPATFTHCCCLSPTVQRTGSACVQSHGCGHGVAGQLRRSEHGTACSPPLIPGVLVPSLFLFVGSCVSASSSSSRCAAGSRRCVCGRRAGCGCVKRAVGDDHAS